MGCVPGLALGSRSWGPEVEDDVELPDDLRELARLFSVATQYHDAAGRMVAVGEGTLREILGCLGVDASTPQARAAALEERRLRDWRRMLPPVFVATSGQEHRIWVHVPHGSFARAWAELEDGTYRNLTQLDVWVEPIDVDGRLIGEATFAIPVDLPPGWHTVCATDGRVEQRAPLVVVPARVTTIDRVDGRQWGLMTQVYAMRSRESWGLGDIHDAVSLAQWSAHRGAGFLLLNPMHAASPVAPMAASPYFPATRRFWNPLYLHVEAIPEYRRLAAAAREAVESSAAALRATNVEDALLDRDRVWHAKLEALEALFAVGRTAEREREFEVFRRAQGPALRDFATWCVLSETYGARWTTWSADLRDPRLPAVAAFRARHESRVTFYEWLQWLTDEQLGRAQQAARSAGMSIGMMHDLAVGVDPQGFDAWALGPILAADVTVGAPPDMYNQVGQNWNQPPWRPEALAEAAYLPYRDMLRSVMRHAGALRIDHILGLFRMWWIPAGRPASQGTYVAVDHEAMLGIACLEAERAGVVLIGEDLGTLEPWVRDALLERGILGTVISWFEEDDFGNPRDPAHWRAESLTSITTHDLPPTAGYLRDEHVRLRSELGLLVADPADELSAAAAQRRAWANLCRERGWLAGEVDLGTEAGLDDLSVALHRALASSPAVLIGIGLPDAVGDRRAQNQPGTDTEYPNWCLSMADPRGRPVLLDTVLGELPPPPLTAILEAITSEVPHADP